MSNFIASSKASLYEAALRIDYLQSDEKVIFLTNVTEFGLMNAPFPLSLVLAALKKTKGRFGLLAVYRELQKREDKAVENMIADTRKHLLNGKDTEDDNSVGGFSQRELDLLFKDIRC